MLFVDQLNNSIKLSNYPKRIVSLVPSQSELLWDLGLKNELVGITKFCIHPAEMFKSVTRVGGTKALDIEKIKSLNPDLIIGNKEENEKSQIELLSKQFNVWMSDINDLNDAIEAIELIGHLTYKAEKAQLIAQNIKCSFENLSQVNKSVLYFIWKNPYMVAGKNTFIGDLLSRLGLKNALQEEHLRYPELSIEEIRGLNPEFIFLSSEPYPFQEKHIKKFQDIVPNAQIILVDGEMFSWYGSRLQYSVQYFNTLISKTTV